jgi:hypothetical protein
MRDTSAQVLQPREVGRPLGAYPVIFGLDGFDLAFKRGLAFEQGVQQDIGSLNPGLRPERHDCLDQGLEFSHDGIGQLGVRGAGHPGRRLGWHPVREGGRRRHRGRRQGTATGVLSLRRGEPNAKQHEYV